MDKEALKRTEYWKRLTEEQRSELDVRADAFVNASFNLHYALDADEPAPGGAYEERELGNAAYVTFGELVDEILEAYGWDMNADSVADACFIAMGALYDGLDKAEARMYC